MSTKEKAPSTMGSTACSAVDRSSVSGKERASSSATTSLSVAIEPGSMPTFSASGGGVGQVPVVAEREPGPAHRAVDRLGAGPVGGPVGGVARVADGQVAVEPRQRALVEDGGHQAHVLHHGDGVAVADRHAGRLLAAVLQGEEAVEGEVGHPRPGA